MNIKFLNKVKLNAISFNKVGEILRRVGEIQEPKELKNFIKFAPYSTDIYPESFTPQPISIDAVDDGGIIVFDDNVTEITVIEEAFSGAIPSSIEFCENVRYISSTAFDNCGYTEIKFHSIVPPEFTDGFGHIGASRLLNGIIYYPAGSDYSSLRSVTVDFGDKLLFENFEFVEFTPSPSPKPEQPEQPEDSDFLEMHFEIPMQEDTFFRGGYYGEIEGDHTETFNKLMSFYNKNKVAVGDGNYRVTEEILSEKANITVNGYKVKYIELYDYEGQEKEILMGTNATFFPGGGNVCVVKNASIYFECGGSPTAPKPEDSVIEYHFEVPMEYDDAFFGGAMTGTLEGDYTDVINKLRPFYEENEVDYDVPESVMLEKTNITVNGYRAIGLMEENDGFVLATDAEEAVGGGNSLEIKPTYIYFEHKA